LVGWSVVADDGRCEPAGYGGSTTAAAAAAAVHIRFTISP